MRMHRGLGIKDRDGRPMVSRADAEQMPSKPLQGRRNERKQYFPETYLHGFANYELLRTTLKSDAIANKRLCQMLDHYPSVRMSGFPVRNCYECLNGICPVFPMGFSL
jgi:hypothetical protein